MFPTIQTAEPALLSDLNSPGMSGLWAWADSFWYARVACVSKRRLKSAGMSDTALIDRGRKQASGDGAACPDRVLH